MSEEVQVSQLSPMEALKEVITLSLHADGLARGLYEAVKAIDRGQAQLIVLSQSCNEQSYKKLIQALAKERNVTLIEVPDNKIIGEYAGLSRLRADGTVAKYIGCSCVAIKSYGVDSAARAVVLQHAQTNSLFKP